MRKAVTVATRVLGAEDRLTIKLGGSLGQHLYWDPDASLGQLRESVAILESNCAMSKRVLGSTHPTTDISKRDPGKPKRAEAREGPRRHRRGEALKICKTVVS